ncbi:magnesium/cobalt transporter CorA [Flavobacterium sp. MAH-1]|uniref:Magnesium transport protein CorA n=1 Tax=Flavobacterium agri TaxID=2743471 RepID=A0A7Y8Y4F3_9FLAO|nr:magnesium/cobalt transporter CorA [Flavobacterium agri]NUY82317.1 magnesium/cobalt transporter CorA [Flavobacterium agri]NYA72341.1 magnesium/cobalt transporter CorA [Flavobacterium agri]
MRRIKYKKVRKVQPNYYEYTGSYKSDPVEMQLFVYNEEGYEEYKPCTVERVEKELRDPLQTHDVKWLNIHGLHNIELIRKIGEFLDIEPAIIGDILNVTRRARMEEADNVLFFSIKSILAEESTHELRVEQISFLMTDNLLVSFQEKRSDFFSHLRERIRTGSGIVRKRGNDYLLYLLLDAIMENFFITLERFEEEIEKVLNDSKTAESSSVLVRIEKSRESLNFLKRAVVPLRDALYNLKSIKDDEDYDGIDKSNYTFFARLHQKCLEILDQIEYDNNTLESASNMFFSSQSQRMNQIMKTLTVFSVIFMPLTFIVGVYGMNFDNMPELKTQDGYYAVWGVMIAIAIGMAIYFKRKKWF